MRREKTESKNFRRNKIAEIELARITMIKVVVLVRNLILARIVRMVTFFMRKFGDNVLE